MKVTVIIPFKTDRGWLNKAIESVNRQTYPCELILSQSAGNKSVNVNKGLRRAHGHFIKILDEDDWLPPDAVELSLKNFNGDMIHGNVWYYKGGVKTLYTPQIEFPTLGDLLRKNVISNPSVMYSRRLIDEIGFYDESLDTSEEYEYHLRALKAGMKIGYVNGVLANYRMHPRQKSIGAGVNRKWRKQILKQIQNAYV
jgi:glycosyltransferase involved in cell wall biosynthesis